MTQDLKFTVKTGNDKYGAPVGLYLAKFLGVQEKNHPEYGAGLEWQFEIVEGEHRGKIVTRTTGMDPSPKNACGRMISDLLGGTYTVGTELDLKPCVGLRYKVKVELNSTGNGSRVGTATLMETLPGQLTAPATTPQQPAQTTVPTLPPVSRPSVPPPAARPVPLAEKKFWATWEGSEPKLMTGSEIEVILFEMKTTPDALNLIPDGAPAGTEWKPARSFGFDDPPF